MFYPMTGPCETTETTTGSERDAAAREATDVVNFCDEVKGRMVVCPHTFAEATTLHHKSKYPTSSCGHSDAVVHDTDNDIVATATSKKSHTVSCSVTSPWPRRQ